jgi:hypothetical protein
MDAGQLAELLRAAITGFYIQVAKPRCPDCSCAPVITCGGYSEPLSLSGATACSCYTLWWFVAGIVFVIVSEIGCLVVWYYSAGWQPRRSAAQIALSKRNVR